MGPTAWPGSSGATSTSSAPTRSTVLALEEIINVVIRYLP